MPSELALAVYPNVRLPGYFYDRYDYDVSAEAFARLGVALAERGVRIIGGCCGATPAHIAALSRALAGGWYVAAVSPPPGASTARGHVDCEDTVDHGSSPK